MTYDVIIIGGGPAGMMAAGRAGELGARVLLLEKNNRLGVKLLITGNGRCNITNNIKDYKIMAASLGKNGRFLFSALSKFGVKETVNFFEIHGTKTKVEKNNQVFPSSDRSLDVLNSLVEYLRTSKVEVGFNSSVKTLIGDDKKIKSVILENNQKLVAKKFIICTGGKSYPVTGSTGDGYEWLKKLRHNIITPCPSLVPIAFKEKCVSSLEGLSLSDIGINIFRDNKSIIKQRGDVVFTNDGLSGPAVHELSRLLARQPSRMLKLEIDLYPELDFKQLEQKVLAEFKQANNKNFKNCLENFLSPKLTPVIMGLLEIDGEKKVNLIDKLERKKLIHLLKEWSFEVEGFKGYNRSMVTSGGVDLKEVDPKTMKSKLLDNLYLAGEILDLDGPTGGYNLQVCWSTGYIAGQSAADSLTKD